MWSCWSHQYGYTRNLENIADAEVDIGTESMEHRNSEMSLSFRVQRIAECYTSSTISERTLSKQFQDCFYSYYQDWHPDKTRKKVTDQQDEAGHGRKYFETHEGISENNKEEGHTRREDKE